MSKIFKTLISAILVIVLSFGLFSCDDASGHSADSFGKAYSKKIDSFVKDLEKSFDNVAKYNPQDMKMDAELSFELSDALLSLISSNSDYDISWINDSKLTVSENIKGDMASIALGLGYKNKDVLAANLIMNSVKGEMFMSIPALNDKFAKLEMETFPLEDMESLDINKFFPKKHLLGNVLKATFAKILDGVSTVSYDEVDLEVNGVKQSCVEYSVTFSQVELAALAAGVLETIGINEDFKTLVCDFVKEYNKSAGKNGEDGIESTPEQVYNDLKVEILGLSQQLNLLCVSGYLTEEPALEWTSYITGDLEVIGTEISITVEDENITFYTATARSGNNVGTELYFGNDIHKVIEISGNLVDDGKTLSGSYELKLQGESMLFVDFDGVDMHEYDKGYFVGSISISPSKGLIDLIIDESQADSTVFGALVSSASIKIDVEKNNGEHVKATLSVMSGKVPYASVMIDGKIAKGNTVNVPNKTVNGFEEWAAGADVDKFIDKIEKSGLPDYVVDFLSEKLTGSAE